MLVPNRTRLPFSIPDVCTDEADRRSKATRDVRGILLLLEVYHTTHNSLGGLESMVTFPSNILV